MLLRSAALAAVLAAFTFACSAPEPTSLNKTDSADHADDDDDTGSTKKDSKSTSSKSSTTTAPTEPTKSQSSSQTAPTNTTPTTNTPTTNTKPTTGGGLLDSLPFKLSDLLSLLQGGGNNGAGGFDLSSLFGGLFGNNGGAGGAGGLDLGGLANSQTLLNAPADSTGCCVGTQFFICGANTTTCSNAATTCERAADLDDACAQ